MSDWVEHAIWWQVYPLGFVGAYPADQPPEAGEHRLRRLVDWHIEQPHAPFDLLRLFHRKGNLLLGFVVRIADIELGRPGSIHPLIEELIYVRVCRFFDGLHKISGDYIFTVINLQIMFQSTIESLFA